MSNKSRLRAAALLGAAMLLAPAALAENKLSGPDVGKPLQEAQAAAQAKDCGTAQTKLDVAAGKAKTAYDRFVIEQLRAYCYAQAKSYAKLAASLDAQNGSGFVDAATVQKNMKAIPGLYDQAGDSGKALAAAKAFMNKYGTDADLAAYVAGKSLGSKDYAGAVEWGQKAIEAARKAGRKPDEKWHQIVLKAHYDTKNDAGYVQALQRLAVEYPKDAYWRDLALRAEKAPGFNANEMRLDVFRLLAAAPSVKLTDAERITMGELALVRKLPAEAEAILAPLLANGGELANERNQRLLDTAKKDAAADRSSLAALEQDAAGKPTGVALANIGEVYMSLGQLDKAVALLKAAIDKGGMTPQQANAARLRLGLAHFRAGDVEDARAVWKGISGDDPAAVLARTWAIVPASAAG
jgi:hypothetical protein